MNEMDYDNAVELAWEVTEEWAIKKRVGLDFVFVHPKHEFVEIAVAAMNEEDARIHLARLFGSEFAL